MRGNGGIFLNISIFLYNSDQDLFTNVALYITAIINNSIRNRRGDD